MMPSAEKREKGRTRKKKEDLIHFITFTPMITSETFRQLALALQGAEESPHFERTSFRVNKKIFATLDIKLGLACLMFDPIQQSVFSAHDKTIIYPVPNKWGLKGATYIDLKKVKKSVAKDALKVAYDLILEKNKKKKV